MDAEHNYQNMGSIETFDRLSTKIIAYAKTKQSDKAIKLKFDEFGDEESNGKVLKIYLVLRN